MAEKLFPDDPVLPVAEDYKELGWQEPDETEAKSAISDIYQVLNARQYSEENQK